MITALNAPPPAPTCLTQACTTLQPSAEALGWGRRPQNPWEGRLAGVAGAGGKPESFFRAARSDRD